jgi:uncharacterized protein (DUF885 family)
MERGTNMNGTDGNTELKRCMEEYWEFFLEQNPLFATYIGDHRYNERLEDRSEESFTRQAAFYGKLLERLKAINGPDLTEENILNLSLLKEQIENYLRFYRMGTQYLPLDHMQGYHIEFPQIIEYHPFATTKDLDDYITRLHAFPGLIDQVIGNLRKGISRGMVQFSKSMDYVLSQVETFSKREVREHPLFTPANKLTDAFSAPEKEKISREIENAISSSVTPAYIKLLAYLKDEYAASCRQDAGIWALPNGTEMYRAYVRFHTTTGLSPEEIHETGLREVARIGGQIRDVLEKTGFSGTEREFAAGLKGRKEFFPVERAELLEGFREILSRMDEKLPEYFGRLPRARYDIKEIEKYREEAAPAAYYYAPPKDFSRPGIFYVNTYKPEEKPKFTMEALAYHEAVPGHHLQVALMQEQENLPDFRRYEGATSFIEGWALYAEKLSEEMGFYADLYSVYGKLTYEMWRAVRLVVDTGIHFLRWSREQSIEYCRDNTALDMHEIEVEVDRYAVIPGQALAYKIGELKILEIREKARKSLGDNFDIREFHDRILEHGALPIFALEEAMSAWIRSYLDREK